MKKTLLSLGLVSTLSLVAIAPSFAAANTATKSPATQAMSTGLYADVPTFKGDVIAFSALTNSGKVSIGMPLGPISPQNYYTYVPTPQALLNPPHSFTIEADVIDTKGDVTTWISNTPINFSSNNHTILDLTSDKGSWHPAN